MKSKGKYNHQAIEKKWQKIWAKPQFFKVPEEKTGLENFYLLTMFPYSSGNLHIGHWYNFAPGDIYARYQKMRGKNVIYPIGFDSFGLPAENAAIKKKIHPRKWTERNIKKMREQLKTIGAMFDWSREVITSRPDYYKWTQWLFLQFYKNGLAYRAKVPANWCPSCQTVLANEQVINGHCERCEAEVIQKNIEQWMFKQSEYAEELLEYPGRLDWPEKTKTMQKNWIGRSEGVEIKFQISTSQLKADQPLADQLQITVFTTRADTLFGATYIVLAPEHPLVQGLKSKIQNWDKVEKYIEKTQKKSELERTSLEKEKSGVELKGVKAVNPVNNKEIPVWISDYVLLSYGTGAIMAVPAHDDRDYAFAKKYKLPIIQVIKPPEMVEKPLYEKTLGAAAGVVTADVKVDCWTGDGTMIHSGQFDGLPSQEAAKKIVEMLKRKKLGNFAVNYKLRDWLISRQRYWGAPIPIIYCDKCGEVPVPEKDLPVELPEKVDFKPHGESPLKTSSEFVNTNCPQCGGRARRETDTMDTFVCSAWYFYRYCDVKNDNEFASKEKIKKWLPVNLYIGGAEHTVMHLLYARFFCKAMIDIGLLPKDVFPEREPFLKLRHQGVILGPDRQKMSKSRGNVVDPDELVKKYGADTVRMYLCFMGSYDQGGPWDPKGIVGVRRFLDKIWSLGQGSQWGVKDERALNKIIHQTIKKVGEDIENLSFNTAIAQLMTLLNKLSKSGVDKTRFEIFLKILSPFAPHLASELWEKLGHKDSIFDQRWPVYDKKLIQEEEIELVIQVNGRVRDRIKVSADISEEKAKEKALASEKIKKYVKGEPKKVVFVKGRLINLVI